MKIIRYQDAAGRIHHAARQPDGSALRLVGDIHARPVVTAETADIARLLAPVVPSQILCIGLNYRQHAAETGAPVPERPILFVKGINTACGPDDPILIPTHLRSDEVDYECELAVVIGCPCKIVSRAEALSYVLGYTCCNDVSARDHQLRLGGGQWCRGKFFDTFAPLGPVLVTPDELPDRNALRIRTRLNGETVQDSTTADMIFDVPRSSNNRTGAPLSPARPAAARPIVRRPVARQRASGGRQRLRWRSGGGGFLSLSCRARRGAAHLPLAGDVVIYDPQSGAARLVARTAAQPETLAAPGAAEVRVVSPLAGGLVAPLGLAGMPAGAASVTALHVEEPGRIRVQLAHAGEQLFWCRRTPRVVLVAGRRRRQRPDRTTRLLRLTLATPAEVTLVFSTP